MTVIVIGKDKESNETPPTPEEADVRGRQSATSEGGVKGDWMPGLLFCLFIFFIFSRKG